MKKLKLMLACVLCLLILLPGIFAIGIRPANTNIIFENSHNASGKFWVYNDNNREFDVNIYVENKTELAEYVTLRTERLDFKESDSALSVSFEVNLPDIIPPGLLTEHIIIEETIPGSEEGVYSRIILKHKINIQGPYPEKFIKAKLNFHERAKNMEIVSEVENLGKLDLKEVKTTFIVNNIKNDTQVRETESTSLKKKENKLLKQRISKDYFESGEYEVRAITTFDDQEIEVVKHMRIGSPQIDIVYFNQFFMGDKVNDYTLDLLNLWNKKIDNVWVEVDIEQDGEKVDTFRTPSTFIEGGLLKRIQDYLDLRSKSLGEYTFKMVVHYLSVYQMKSQSFSVELLDEESYENKQKDSLTGAITDEVDTSTSPFWIVIFIIALVLGIAFVDFIYSKKKKQKYYSGDDNDEI